MLSYKPWKPESVLRLLMFLFAALGLTGLLGYVVDYCAAGLSQDSRRLLVLVFQTFFYQGVSLALVVWFLRDNAMSWSEAFGFRNPRLGASLLLAFVTGVLVIPVNMSLMWVSQWIMESQSLKPVSQQTVEILRATASWERKAILGVMAVILAPVVEEILFRGILYPALKQVGLPRLALWGTSITFALTHANLPTFLPLTFFAVVLVLLYERTDNLLAPILAHGLFNGANYVWIVLSS